MKILGNYNIISKVFNGRKISNPKIKPPLKIQTRSNNKSTRINRFFNYINENLVLAGFKIKSFICDAKNYIYNKIFKTSKTTTVYNMGKGTKSRMTPVRNYLKRHLNNNINPAELERYLSKIAIDVEEVLFVPNPEKGITMGRKKIFTLKNGKKIILECHDDKLRNRVVTRVYDSAKKPSQRTYLDRFGSLKEKSYFSADSHIESGNLGVNWIQQAA